MAVSGAILQRSVASAGAIEGASSVRQSDGTGRQFDAWRVPMSGGCGWGWGVKTTWGIAMLGPASLNVGPR